MLDSVYMVVIQHENYKTNSTDCSNVGKTFCVCVCVCEREPSPWSQVTKHLQAAAVTEGGVRRKPVGGS